MSKLRLVILSFLAFYTALAQPGLPPCWLAAGRCANHAHINQDPSINHDHDYLRLRALFGASAVIPTRLAAAGLLILILGWTSITRMIAGVILTSKRWGLAPDPPPPRPSVSPSFSL